MQDHSPDNHLLRPFTEDRLGYFLYRSIARADVDEEALQAILAAARIRNAALGLTGCLHFESGVVHQWLEGPWRHVSQLMDKLREDDRHSDMRVLDQGTLTERLFDKWEMRFSDPRAASLFEWMADWNNRADTETAYAARVSAFLRSIREGGETSPRAGGVSGNRRGAR